jgi:uncharacterized protein (DUF2164 family)
MMKIPYEQKVAAMDRIRDYFRDERGEELGNLAAESLFDFMLKTVGPFAYNQALHDARRVYEERLLSAEDELYALEKPTAPPARG